ncbi:MAG: HNH endonuclease signature motif containing protein [Gemmatimonadota bacterium]|nr:HNH endonuclease signature motif containing protein [Gemmatimonadota bacterium]
MTAKRPAGPRRRSRRGKGGGAYAPAPKVTLTSVPTGRAAYTDTRVWLLEQHGPVCAYCESAIPLRSVTLDHVTPRRGQTAYDRRDNLVLCCKACNAAKKDQAILAFLLGNKKRVVALYKYGQHLSHQLVEMVKDLLPEHERPVLPTVPHAKRVRRKTSAEIFGHHGAGASPYLDEPAVAPPRHVPQAVHVAHAARVARAAPVAPAPAAAAPKKKRSRRGGRGRTKKPQA